jgi:hypothetical protein
MTRYPIPIPAELRPYVTGDTPEAITEFLAERGITAAAVSIQTDATGAPAVLSVIADTDPRPALADYDPQRVSERVARLHEGIGLLGQYADAVEAGVTPSPANTAQAVRIFYRVLVELLGDDPRIRAILAGEPG